MRCIFLAMGLLLTIVSSASKAQTPKPGQIILDQLRAGGFIIFMRHAPATVGEDKISDANYWKDCALQRQLSTDGRATAREIGYVLRGLLIPVERVISGELCRVKETAELLGFSPVETTPELNDYNTWKAQGRDPDQLVSAYRKQLSVSVAPGKNLVLVSHAQRGKFSAHPVLDLIEMSGAAIFRPANSGFELVAVIHASDWMRLGISEPPFPR